MSGTSCPQASRVTGFIVAFTGVTVLSLCIMGLTIVVRWSSVERAVGEAVGHLGRSAGGQPSTELEHTAQLLLARQARHSAAVLAARIRRDPQVAADLRHGCTALSELSADPSGISDELFVWDLSSGTVHTLGSPGTSGASPANHSAQQWGLNADVISADEAASTVLTRGVPQPDGSVQRRYLALAAMPAMSEGVAPMLVGVTMPVEEALRESRRIQVATDGIAEQVRDILAAASSGVRHSVHSSLAVVVMATAFLLAISGWMAVRNARLLADSERWHRGLIENALVGMFVYRDGKFRFVNRRLGELLGCEPEVLVGSSLLDWVHPDYRDQVARRIGMRLSGQEVPDSYELPVVNAQGETRWADLWARATGHGPDQEVLVTAIDITERKLAERRLQLSEQKFRTFTEKALHPVWVVQDGRIAYCNSALAFHMGLERPEDAHGLLVRRIAHRDDWPQLEAKLGLLVAGRSEAERIVVRFVALAEQVRWHEVQFARIEYEGRPAVLADSQDITELKLLMEQLDAERLRDSLTGLYNRRHFRERFLGPSPSTERRRTSLTLLMLDVDGFKVINDVFGHAVGDRVLQAVAEVLRRQLRDSDIAIRFGGDEFLVVMPSVSAAAAEAKAKRISEELVKHLRKLAREKALPDEASNLVWLSGGAATCGRDGEDSLDEALRLADERMYRHKQRNKWARKGTFPGAVGRHRRIG